ncbi:hypothetical protein ACIQZN_31080 [Streptomyces sp. NPDC097595]|uniref:hypothetical protein n=1 Tax=Streptomyces sp. NPDC097595 TaxID=3366090 RepID=UPI0037FC3C3E
MPCGTSAPPCGRWYAVVFPEVVTVTGALLDPAMAELVPGARGCCPPAGCSAAGSESGSDGRGSGRWPRRTTAVR